MIPPDITPAFPVPVAGPDVRSKFIELLGLDHVPSEVDAVFGPVDEQDGLAIASFQYRNSLCETVPGVLVRPLRVEGPLPGIVCLPGTPETAEDVQAPRLESNGTLLSGWGRELARRGFATLAISLKGTVIRRGQLDRWETEAKLLAPYGRPQLGIITEEAIGAARVLAAQDDVDGERIGMAGLSLGGLATWYAMACAPWITVGAPVCGALGSMAIAVHHGQADRASSAIYLPHLLRYFDHGTIVANAIAPRPLLMVAPTEDEDMPRQGVDALIEAVRPAYEKAGHPERFRVHRPPGRHEFRPEYFPWVADWFGEHLRR